MTENKKIKKLERINKSSTQRFKKSNFKPSRAPVALINRPARIPDQNDVYLIEGDLCFGVKNDSVFFDISLLNLFKFITSVEIRKDLNEKIVTLLLEPKQHQSLSSWHTVVNDFESSDAPALKEWVEPLKSFGTKYESFLKDFENLKKETDLQRRLFLFKMRQQAAAKRLYILSTFPAFEVRYRMKPDGIKCTELCYNETFLKEMGYTLDNFTSTVLTEGIPQFLPQGSPSERDFIKGVIDNFMVNDKESPEVETEILMKSGYRKKIIFQCTSLVELSENDVIVSHILHMKTKSLPFGSYQKQPYSPEFLDILKENDKQKEYLFNTYYGENIQGLHSNTEKVCKIKDLVAP